MARHIVRVSAERRTLGQWLLRGWNAAGHISLANDIQGWIWRAVSACGILAAVTSGLSAMWGMVLFLGGVTLTAAVVAFLKDQPHRRRPVIIGSIGGTASLRQFEHGEGVTIFLRVCNLGVLTPLTAWKAWAIIGGQQYPLRAIPYTIRNGHLPGGVVVPMEENRSMLEQTLQPVGMGFVSGYLVCVTRSLNESDFNSMTTEYVVHCEDVYGTTWELKAPPPLQRADDGFFAIGVTKPR